MACTQLVQVENNEMQDKEEEVARPSLKYAYGRRDIAPIFSGVSRFHKRNELDNEKRQVQASNMFSQLTSDHQVKVCTLNIASNIYLFTSIFLFENVHLHASKY